MVARPRDVSLEGTKGPTKGPTKGVPRSGGRK